MVLNEKRTIIGIGTSGLIGSRICELLKSSYTFINLRLSEGVDITRKETLNVIETFPKDAIVLLLAAKADVDGCEKDKETDTMLLQLEKQKQEEEFVSQKTAWAINVFGVENVISACLKNNNKLIYMSTDFVFDGNLEKKTGYEEGDIPRPINWYGDTKYQAEIRILESTLPSLIVRVAYPYRTAFLEKRDFVRTIIGKLKNKEKISAVSDHVMSPTFIDDIAYALDLLVTHGTDGIYHTVGSQFISPYDAACTIASAFSLDTSLIQKTTRAEFFKNRAARPFDLSINNDKIERLGIHMKTFDEGIFELKRQL